MGKRWGGRFSEKSQRPELPRNSRICRKRRSPWPFRFRLAGEIYNRLRFPEQQPSIHALLAAIWGGRALDRLNDSQAISAAIDDLCKSIDMPLAAIAMKHLGDLSADADAWYQAEAFYQAAMARLSGYESTSWTPYVELWRTLTRQSIAAALRVTRGTKLAGAFLSGQLVTSSLNDNPLLLLNAAHDTYVAQSLGAEGIYTFPPPGIANVGTAPGRLA